MNKCIDKTHNFSIVMPDTNIIIRIPLGGVGELCLLISWVLSKDDLLKCDELITAK